MSRAALVLVALLAACGVSESNWRSETAAISCDMMFTCLDEASQEFLPYADVDECLAANEDGEQVDTDDCDYSRKVAAECLDEWYAMDCSGYNAGSVPTCNPYSCE